MAGIQYMGSWKFLETPEQRQAAQVGRNLLEGACRVLRAQQLRSAGVSIPSSAFVTQP